MRDSQRSNEHDTIAGLEKKKSHSVPEYKKRSRGRILFVRICTVSRSVVRFNCQLVCTDRDRRDLSVDVQKVPLSRR